MLGWIALTLMLWLAAALRTMSGPRPVTRDTAASCLDAASLEPDPVIPAGMTKKLRRRCLPTSEPPPLLVETGAPIGAPMHQFCRTKTLNLLN